ncbi:MAG: VWA domain-containing protein [Chloroflexota bacterium]
MGVLLPAALALLALAIPIIIFYMLRLRREELSVSSSLLWRRALQDRTANAPWQRLRRNILLLLQLLLLLLLVFSLARPFVFTQSIASGNVVAVLDASASMQANDAPGNATRFDRAREQIDSLIDGLSNDSRMTLIWAGPSSQTVASASGNKAALHAALKGLAPSNGKSDMPSAITLAAAAARQLGNATVVLVSDGALGPQSVLPQVPTRARYITVGTSANNVGITALSLRDAPDGPQLFAGVYNSGPITVTALLTINVDGQLRDSRSVRLGAKDEQTLTLQALPLTTKLVEAKLTFDAGDVDTLAADNTAWALRPVPPASNVLLVTAGNGFLEKSLGLLPGLKLFKSAPEAYAHSDAFHLTVLDAFMPAQLPPSNLLIFAPTNSPLVPVSGTIPYPAIGQVAVNDPLLRFVDLSKVNIAAAQRIITPSWARVLVRSTAGDPLILAGETDGRRVVVVAFDLHQSDLPLQVAFPILTANLVEWLQPSTSIDVPPVLSAGDPISIRPLPEADEIIVTPPGSGARSTTLQPSSEVSFAGTDSLGVYTVQQFANGNPLADPEQFAVNLFSRDESDITPRPDLAFTGTGPTEPVGQQAERPLEIWPYVLLASLLLLAVEWWFYNRAGRLRPPGVPARKPSK